MRRQRMPDRFVSICTAPVVELLLFKQASYFVDFVS